MDDSFAKMIEEKKFIQREVELFVWIMRILQEHWK